MTIYIFVNFDLIHLYLTEELKSRDEESKIYAIGTTNKQKQF